MPNTVTVKQRKTSGPNRYLVNQQWTFTDDLNSTFHEETGIAFDGRFLWFCSTGGALRFSKLLAVDPVSRQQTIPSFDIQTLTANESALDIVWNGQSWDSDRWALYCLTVDTTPNYYLYVITHGGKRIRRMATLSLAAPILSYSALAWDGRFLYIQHIRSTGAQSLTKWDPRANTKQYDIALQSSGNLGGGVVHDGWKFICHIHLFNFLADVHSVFPYHWRGAGALQLIRRTIAEALGGTPFIGPCTFDGGHMYTFEI